MRLFVTIPAGGDRSRDNVYLSSYGNAMAIWRSLPCNSGESGLWRRRLSFVRFCRCARGIERAIDADNMSWVAEIGCRAIHYRVSVVMVSCIRYFSSGCDRHSAPWNTARDTTYRTGRKEWSAKRRKTISTSPSTIRRIRPRRGLSPLRSDAERDPFICFLYSRAVKFIATRFNQPAQMRLRARCSRFYAATFR